MIKSVLRVTIVPTVLCLLVTCRTNERVTPSDAIVGMWNIDEVNGSDEYLICFLTNVLHFDPSICKLPVSNGVCDSLGAEDSGGIWNLSRSTEQPYYLTIGSRNEFFSGKYLVIFEDDSLNKLMKMHLLSDRLDLQLRKWHVSYDQERNMVRQLAKETALAAESVNDQ